jgi:hypothetical protein
MTFHQVYINLIVSSSAAAFAMAKIFRAARISESHTIPDDPTNLRRSGTCSASELFARYFAPTQAG